MSWMCQNSLKLNRDYSAYESNLSIFIFERSGANVFYRIWYSLVEHYIFFIFLILNKKFYIFNLLNIV